MEYPSQEKDEDSVLERIKYDAVSKFLNTSELRAKYGVGLKGRLNRSKALQVFSKIFEPSVVAVNISGCLQKTSSCEADKSDSSDDEGRTDLSDEEGNSRHKDSENSYGHHSANMFNTAAQIDLDECQRSLSAKMRRLSSSSMEPALSDMSGDESDVDNERSAINSSWHESDRELHFSEENCSAEERTIDAQESSCKRFVEKFSKFSETFASSPFSEIMAPHNSTSSPKRPSTLRSSEEAAIDSDVTITQRINSDLVATPVYDKRRQSVDPSADSLREFSSSLSDGNVVFGSPQVHATNPESYVEEVGTAADAQNYSGQSESSLKNKRKRSRKSSADSYRKHRKRKRRRETRVTDMSADEWEWANARAAAAARKSSHSPSLLKPKDAEDRTSKCETDPPTLIHLTELCIRELTSESPMPLLEPFRHLFPSDDTSSAQTSSETRVSSKEIVAESEMMSTVVCESTDAMKAVSALGQVRRKKPRASSVDTCTFDPHSMREKLADSNGTSICQIGSVNSYSSPSKPPPTSIQVRISLRDVSPADFVAASVSSNDLSDTTRSFSNQPMETGSVVDNQTPKLTAKEPDHGSNTSSNGMQQADANEENKDNNDEQLQELILRFGRYCSDNAQSLQQQMGLSSEEMLRFGEIVKKMQVVHRVAATSAAAASSAGASTSSRASVNSENGVCTASVSCASEEQSIDKGEGHREEESIGSSVRNQKTIPPAKEAMVVVDSNPVMERVDGHEAEQLYNIVKVAEKTQVANSVVASTTEVTLVICNDDPVGKDIEMTPTGCINQNLGSDLNEIGESQATSAAVSVSASTENSEGQGDRDDQIWHQCLREIVDIRRRAMEISQQNEALLEDLRRMEQLFEQVYHYLINNSSLGSIRRQLNAAGTSSSAAFSGDPKPLSASQSVSDLLAIWSEQSRSTHSTNEVSTNEEQAPATTAIDLTSHVHGEEVSNLSRHEALDLTIECQASAMKPTDAQHPPARQIVYILPQQQQASAAVENTQLDTVGVVEQSPATGDSDVPEEGDVDTSIRVQPIRAAADASGSPVPATSSVVVATGEVGSAVSRMETNSATVLSTINDLVEKIVRQEQPSPDAGPEALTLRQSNDAAPKDTVLSSIVVNLATATSSSSLTNGVAKATDEAVNFTLSSAAGPGNMKAAFGQFAAANLSLSPVSTVVTANGMACEPGVAGDGKVGVMQLEPKPVSPKSNNKPAHSGQQHAYVLPSTGGDYATIRTTLVNEPSVSISSQPQAVRGSTNSQLQEAPVNKVPASTAPAQATSSSSSNIGAGVANERSRRCSNCSGVAQMLCAGCKSVFYCSPQCQLQSWVAGHSLRCMWPKTSAAKH